MGFWGGLGKGLKAVGKGALKVAPIAASFIPGVGPMAAMGIGAATGGLSNKLSGGSFKGGMLGGAMQGGIGALGKAAMFGKGLNPSAGFMSRMGRSAMGAMGMGRMRGPISGGYGGYGGTPPFVAPRGGVMGRTPSYTRNMNPFAQSIANNSRSFTMGNY